MSVRRRARRAALILAGALAPLGAAPLQGQITLAPRPWLDWQTAETEHFVFHYPREFRLWTLALAERMDGVRAQVTRIVGFAPSRRVHVVVDDPANLPNGYAFTPLDAPTIVLWPTPPDPRTEIGNSRVWSELLATHEYAHVAHLMRPSRNRLQQLLRTIAPVPLGPIATKAPRWVLEGYATYVEGRVTGTGRPNNAWRAAAIRQFALEGKMPSYAELSATGGWETGSFAYLMGSAYIEWLVRREGDSSIVAVWRRLTAVTDRSFPQAFAGVYGAPPEEMYGRFSAEVTADALAFERALRREGLQDGTLVQRLTRTTGDPAVSPDGRYVALTIRRADAPSQLVVWKTVEEPDTAGARAREQQQERDPQDVPDRPFYPPPKKPVATLVANDGAPYETPRWFADNKHLLVTRLVPMADGALRPDLYIWNADDGSLRRLSHGASLRDADPSPDGRWAAAVHCAHGWCDLVRVDLASGELRTLRSGTTTRNYYRPRVSRTTGEIVVAEQSNDRWRIARIDSRTGELRYLDPDDGVTRYDATWTPDGSAVVTTSEAGGVANLERLGGLAVPPKRLTTVTGAAVAPDVSVDGTIWYLSLHGKGYDLRRLRPDTTREPPPIAVVSSFGDSLSPVLPPRAVPSPSDTTRRPAIGLPPSEHDYGFGPSRVRYLPSSTTGSGGSSTQLALVRTDPVGRLAVSLLGSVGAGALPAGGALQITVRRSRTILTTNGWISHEAPSRVLAHAAAVGLDLTRAGGALRLDRTHVGDGGEITATLAGLSERQRALGADPGARSAGIFAFDGVARQRDDETRYLAQLEAMGELGRSPGGAYHRQRAAFTFGTGVGTRPLTRASFAYGTVGGDGAERERFVVGGLPSPRLDSLYDARRVTAPAYPLASRIGSTFATYRVGVPLAPFELFYSGATTDFFHTAARSYGVEVRATLPEIAALGTPAIDAVSGFARAVDDPVKDAWRYYVSVAIRP